MRLAKIEDNRVTNIILSQSAIDGYIQAPETLAVGDVQQPDGTFISPDVVEDPENPTVTMTIVADQTRVSPGTMVNITVTVAAPVTQEYLVPVLRMSDQKQVDMVAVPVTNGQATFGVTFAEKGVYTISIDKIIPVPTAELVGEFQIVVI